MTRNHILARALLLSLGFAVAGCSSNDGAQTSTNAGPTRAVAADDRPAPTTEIDKFAALGYRLEWRGVGLVSRGARTADFEVFDDIILYMDTGNVLTCIEASTGRSRWASEMDTELARFVGMTRRDDRVYAASQGELFVLDARTGEIVERHRLAVVVNTPPLIMGDMVILGGAAGEVLGHNLRSTYKQWGYRLTRSIQAQPVQAGDAVAVVSQGGDVLILDPQTGASLGRNRIFDELENNPAADEDAVYVASTDQSVYAFKRLGGELLWRDRNERPITDHPVVHNGRLYVSIAQRGMVCFDAATGEALWTAKDVKGHILGMSDGDLIAWDGTDAVLLDASNGDEIIRVQFPGFAEMMMEGFDNGPIYTVTWDGRIARFSPRF